MVLFGGRAWFYSGGHAGFYLEGGMRGFFSFFGYNEIQSMSGRYASYWNAFLLFYCSTWNVVTDIHFQIGVIVYVTFYILGSLTSNESKMERWNCANFSLIFELSV